MDRVRKSFAKTRQIMEPPHLIAMQRHSYERFLQRDIHPDEREDFGLQAIFKNIFPITDFNGLCSLEFVRYSFGEAKYTVEECIERGMTYEVPVKITVRLITFDVDEETGVQSVRDIKEQEVFLGSLPLMTKDGVFVVNGTERVVVNQLQRSPGLFYTHDNGKSHSSGKRLYSARIIPVRGSWLDFEFDIKDVLYVRIDRRRKLPVTTLLKALGYTSEQLLREFYDVDTVLVEQGKYALVFKPETFIGQRLNRDLVDPETGEVMGKKGRKISKALAKRIAKAGIETIEIDPEDLLGRYLVADIADPKTGDLIGRCNDEVTESMLEAIEKAGIKSFELLFIDGVKVTESFRKTLAMDKVQDTEQAQIEIYRRLRPSSPPTPEVAATFFENLFFNPSTYDLSEVGRYKINSKLGLDTPIETRTLTREDIVKSVKHLVRIKDELKEGDDIDHLGNRRVRTVGELVENQYRMGLVRMERAIRERMTLQEVETLMPHDLVNPKPVTSAIKEFFGTSQLSQFMDQTNPLSEVTHKRRLSALGPGGLSRERAGFEVRDVHPTHYGRICPVETPEGPNIGLIVSLATYARVNPYGFIETPYRNVTERKVTNEVKYLSALQEQDEVIAPARVTIENDTLVEDSLIARQEGEVVMVSADQVTKMDVAPNQLVSVAASLIPFLENDDANRALMGSNMQRQAVPLLKPAAPLVGTGMERHVAQDSGACLLAEGDGVVEEVDATRVVVRYDEPGTGGFETGVAVYRLSKYKKSNQNTCFNQKPLVMPGQRVTRGTVLADGPSTEQGELALGKNVTIAFMPWRGYNFEDSILINERLLKEDTFTSVHIEIFETMARDTKLGKEEITRDIPNVGEEALRNLDDSGIIRIGAEVKAGDMLVGKVTPKGETMLSPEEKLLRAIFGEKAGDVKDSSLRVPPGVEGVVIDAKVFSRKGVDKDERTLMIEEREIENLNRDMEDELKSLKKGVRKALEEILTGRTVKTDIKDRKGRVILKLGKKLTPKVIEQIEFAKLATLDFSERSKYEDEIAAVFSRYNTQAKLVRERYQGIVERMEKGDDLPPGVVKMVKIYVATKRKLAVGDKMAGRHGNKGVVSRLLPEEDMPFFADGTTVDIVLNPLGVPSRMNVGQVLECHLGFAAKKLGEQIAELAQKAEVDAVKERLRKVYSEEEYRQLTDGLSDEELLDKARKYGHGIHVATPVFDGASEEAIRNYLVEAGVDEVGQSVLYDGLTGEPFANKVTVGTMYMLKLHHLVDNKIHARSTGPYSLVTQQPLGGKAQFGGQRLGEMEVWAMEAYGAAYTLKEFLTVKSDDVEGRTTMYEKIVKGNNFLETGLPESFHVLVKELKGLCLDVELLE
ncbi:DNA-directed RNA polymerase subunit beta [Desulfolithobacter dissulfuricans]|uniref:DNA-directed RNA polymerase subunit beta n=1 Tax=Desulfolithobacter dissulfuricans TaxID=2795293 RepID=A0A915U272_9BACT|nr:DNA-directed RNA polymerase subunit beta [Desulfolithobacter dissulfuricans]BCO09978.1 DNA-directed RNA polymerase subunit beta [Desulfolithobacter dissulfuricans]